MAARKKRAPRTVDEARAQLLAAVDALRPAQAAKKAACGSSMRAAIAAAKAPCAAAVRAAKAPCARATKAAKKAKAKVRHLRWMTKALRTDHEAAKAQKKADASRRSRERENERWQELPDLSHLGLNESFVAWYARHARTSLRARVTREAKRGKKIYPHEAIAEALEDPSTRGEALERYDRQQARQKDGQLGALHRELRALSRDNYDLRRKLDRLAPSSSPARDDEDDDPIPF